MSEVIDRPLRDDEKPAASRLRIVDCDVHPSLHSLDDLNEFLPKRWQQHLKDYGSHLRTPFQVLLARHMKAGSQLTPDSISTTLRSGYLPNTPS